MLSLPLSTAFSTLLPDAFFLIRITIFFNYLTSPPSVGTGNAAAATHTTYEQDKHKASNSNDDDDGEHIQCTYGHIVPEGGARDASDWNDGAHFQMPARAS